MKVPLNWLKEYVTLPKDTRILTDKLTMVGHMLDKSSVYKGGVVVDLELRGNRADCYSIYGIAREVAAIFETKIKAPELINLKKGQIRTKLNVKTNLVKRVGMLEVRNVTIKKSPKWLSEKLEAYGMESINNIVDLTNFVMIETGEPMHAFDADKIGDNLTIRLAKNGEKIETFQGNEVTLTKDDMVWAKDRTVLSVAGAVGEKHNSISDSTKNILVEAANYDRANIRRTVYRHKLFTDAGIRHEKELDPNMVDIALARFLYLLQKNKWGTFRPVYFDYYPNTVGKWNIKVSLDQINNLGGVGLDIKNVSRILKGLNFEIVSNVKNIITVSVPTYRTDVVLPEDVIEEVLRIYGYENIPAKTLSLEIPGNITPEFISQEENLRNSAVAVGLDEAITLSFVTEKAKDLNVHPEDVGHVSPELLNPPSPDTKYMRQSLLPNLMTVAQKIIDERGPSLGLFEIGKVYTKFKYKYLESRKLGIIYWRKDKNDFRSFKGIVEAFFAKSNLPTPVFTHIPKNISLIDSYDLKLNKDVVGFGGMIKDMYFIEIDLDSILSKDKKHSVSLWHKYPPQIEDVTLVFPSKTYIGEVVNLITSMNRFIEKVELKDIYKDAYTFRIWYQAASKTLQDQEVEKIRNEMLSKVKEKFGGVVKS